MILMLIVYVARHLTGRSRCTPGLERADGAIVLVRPAAPARPIGSEQRGAAHRDGAEPGAARNTPLPGPALRHHHIKCAA
jgi:hypothetical protein